MVSKSINYGNEFFGVVECGAVATPPIFPVNYKNPLNKRKYIGGALSIGGTKGYVLYWSNMVSL